MYPCRCKPAAYERAMDPEETAAYRANEPATVKLAMDGTMLIRLTHTAAKTY